MRDKEPIANPKPQIHPTCYGGIGNMGRSSSRDTADNTNFTAGFSNDHCGADNNNIISGEGQSKEVIDVEECREHAPATESTNTECRGVAGNIADITPNSKREVEQHPHDTPKFESTRCNASMGDIIRDCDRSSSPSSPPCFLNGECRF